MEAPGEVGAADADDYICYLAYTENAMSSLSESATGLSVREQSAPGARRCRIVDQAPTLRA
jgi:hypothetical protein